MLEVAAALYVTVALAAMARTYREARCSDHVRPLGLCVGLALCLVWLPLFAAFVLWGVVDALRTPGR